MNAVAPSATADIGNQPELQPAYWRTFATAMVSVGLTLTATYFFFGWGIILLTAAAFSLLASISTLLFVSPAENENLRMIFRRLLPKVVITGIFWQTIGFFLISTPNIANTRRFFVDADVEFKRGRLVETLNYRTSMSGIEISSVECDKLFEFYLAQAKADTTQYEWAHPDQCAYFEVPTLGREFAEAIRYDDNFTNQFLNLEKSDGDWIDNYNLGLYIKDLLDGYPEINEGDGRCRILIWEPRGGSNRYFIWFEKTQTGYLKCNAGFG